MVDAHDQYGGGGREVRGLTVADSPLAQHTAQAKSFQIGNLMFVDLVGGGEGV